MFSVSICSIITVPPFSAGLHLWHNFFHFYFQKRIKRGKPASIRLFIVFYLQQKRTLKFNQKK